MAKVARTVISTTDLEPIKEITSGILGELCWEARLGYGDELKLEIGAKKHTGIREHGISGTWVHGALIGDLCHKMGQ